MTLGSGSGPAPWPHRPRAPTLPAPGAEPPNWSRSVPAKSPSQPLTVPSLFPHTAPHRVSYTVPHTSSHTSTVSHSHTQLLTHFSTQCLPVPLRASQSSHRFPHALPHVFSRVPTQFHTRVPHRSSHRLPHFLSRFHSSPESARFLTVLLAVAHVPTRSSHLLAWAPSQVLALVLVPPHAVPHGPGSSRLSHRHTRDLAPPHVSPHTAGPHLAPLAAPRSAQSPSASSQSYPLTSPNTGHACLQFLTQPITRVLRICPRSFSRFLSQPRPVSRSARSLRSSRSPSQRSWDPRHRTCFLPPLLTQTRLFPPQHVTRSAGFPAAG